MRFLNWTRYINKSWHIQKHHYQKKILFFSVFASIFDFVLDQKSYVDFLHEYDVFA